MANILQELESENLKSGLFDSRATSISYPLGFPILDQQLGAIYRFKDKDGNLVETKHLGIQAGTFTMLLGQSSSGKTTAAIQMAWNIVEPFGEDAIVVHRDAEKATGYERVQSLTGASIEELHTRYLIQRDDNRWSNLLKEITKLAEKKQSDPKRYMYKTGRKDIFGEEEEYYIPTVIIADSLMKFISDTEEIDEMSGQMSGGREAAARSKFYRNALEFMNQYNINVFVINHLNDAMPKPGSITPPAKQLPFLPTGKIVPGGEKPLLLTSAIIFFNPVKSKAEIRTEEENGYSGLPCSALVCKSRTSKGGTVSMMEFVQEVGFDARLTLMNFAKEKGLIQGRNPSCYFSKYPDVKFDTRNFVQQMADNPDVVRTLFMECKPELDKLIPVIDMTSDTGSVITGAEHKKDYRNMMREMF